MSSETDSCREHLEGFCTGNGLDIGFGGSRPIVDSAICVDRAPGHPQRHEEKELLWPTHLAWDCFARLPFADGTLDYVYSSHTLEDAADTAGVLDEWCRVIKPGGHLVLFLPDQVAYVTHCLANGVKPNAAHRHDLFCRESVLRLLPAEFEVVEAVWPFHGNAYSFSVVAKRKTYE